MGTVSATIYGLWPMGYVLWAVGPLGACKQQGLRGPNAVAAK